MSMQQKFNITKVLLTIFCGTLIAYPVYAKERSASDEKTLIDKNSTQLREENVRSIPEKNLFKNSSMEDWDEAAKLPLHWSVWCQLHWRASLKTRCETKIFKHASKSFRIEIKGYANVSSRMTKAPVGKVFTLTAWIRAEKKAQVLAKLVLLTKKGWSGSVRQPPELQKLYVLKPGKWTQVQVKGIIPKTEKIEYYFNLMPQKSDLYNVYYIDNAKLMISENKK